jgi:hypothetical protein
MREERAETLLIIAKAIGLSWPTVKAILSARARACSVWGGEIAQCAVTYERLRATTAQEIVRSHRLRGKAATRPPT